MQNGDIAKDAVSKRRLLNPDFEKLAYVRHNFGFHYNHESNSEETEKAIKAYAARRAELKTTESAMVYRDSGKRDMRFPIADEVLKVAMAQGAGITIKDDHTNDKEFQAHKQFRTGLAMKLLTFADACLIAWIVDNVKSGRTMSIKGEKPQGSKLAVMMNEAVSVSMNNLGFTAKQFQHRYNTIAKATKADLFLKSAKFRTNENGVRLYETTINAALAVSATIDSATDMLTSLHFAATADPKSTQEKATKNLTISVIQLVQAVHPNLSTEDGERLFNDLGLSSVRTDIKTPVRNTELDGFKYQLDFNASTGMFLTITR